MNDWSRLLATVRDASLFVVLRDRIGTIKYLLRYEWLHHFLARFGRSHGVIREKRPTPVVVSLTSIPERLDKLHLCIESLLRQSCKPDYLILWLDETVVDPLPDALLRLKRRGLTIRRCRNIRSYKKIIFALKEYPNAIIVTADDDFFYPRHWLRELYTTYQQAPHLIHCHRAHLIITNDRHEPLPYHEWKFESPGVVGPSKLLFPTGAGGVLYPPASLHREVLNEEVFWKICPTSDDIWLKAMALMAGTSARKVRASQGDFVQVKGTQTTALWHENVVAGRNSEQLRAVFDKYGLYERLIERGTSADCH